MIKNKVDFKLINLALIAFIAYILYQTSNFWLGTVNKVISVLSPLFIAFILAYVLYPYFKYLQTKGIPKGYLDKNGYRQNYIHATEINGVETNEDILNQVISYDTDGVMLWNGKRCESIPTTKEEQLEIQEMINKLCGKDDER